MRLTDFDYELSPELIAQHPLDRRDASRMLVVDRTRGAFSDRTFTELESVLDERDVLVVNNTKVFPARLVGRTETGGAIEIFLVRELENVENAWEALARPLRRLRPGKQILFEGLSAEVITTTDEGRAIVRFDIEGDIYAALEQIGRTPLPPYIRRGVEEQTNEDRERYQTVFARATGAIAAPTAGLHFTPAVLAALKNRGVRIAELTLHVGYGTFEPVRVNDLSEHRVMPERYAMSEETAELLNRTKAANGRIVAVGTTTTRALEHSVFADGKFKSGAGMADLTITPGCRFRAVDALLTNFHLPKSSLLILVSTFGGHELIMNAYGHAVEHRYRFYSYGDCMFIC